MPNFASHHSLCHTEAMAQTLFPTIGTVADQTDNLQAREADGNVGGHASSTLSTNDNGEKVVQEVESLCMKCGEH